MFVRTLRNIYNEKIFAPSNILRVLGIITGRALTGPLKVMVDITNRCDMGCVMCWYHSPHLNKIQPSLSDMPMERFRDLVKELRRIQTKVVTLCGEGEPLLHGQIEEMVETVRQNSMDVEIFTNGLYLDKEKVDYFKKAGVKKILVSLHATDKETFAKIRMTRAVEDFSKTMDNLFYLAQVRSPHKRPQLFIINVISHVNHDNIPGMIKLAENLDADKVLFKPLKNLPNLPAYLQLSESDIKNMIEVFRMCSSKITVGNNIRDYVKSLHNLLNPAGKSQAIKLPISLFKCHIPWVYSEIGLQGDVVGCLYAKGQSSQGNIYESPFPVLWYNDFYKDFRKGFFCSKTCFGRAVYPLLV